MEAEREVLVLCYWNGSIKYGPDGVYYEGSTSKKIRVKKKTKLSKLLEGLYMITKFDKKRSKLSLIGRYPVVTVSPRVFTYAHLPVVNDTSLETMLEVPSKHPSIKTVELYLEVKPTSDDVINTTAACSSPLENPGISSKRQRTQQPKEANAYAGMDARLPPVKLAKDNNNGLIQDEAHVNFGGVVGGPQAVNLTEDNSNAHKDLSVQGLETSAANKGGDSCGSKPQQWLSTLWVDDHELCVGLSFKDRDELKKTVDWCSIRLRRKCVVRETEKDIYMVDCVRWKCKWSLCAVKIEEHGLVEITKYTGPHTCCLEEPEVFESEFSSDEIERVVKVQPTLSVSELKKWWNNKYGYKLQTQAMEEAKLKAVRKIYGDWDHSFRVFPKLMAALQSSNGLVVDWRYDVFPNPEFASFCGVFWAFSQSIEGFQHCRPLIVLDSRDLNGKYPMTLMVAMGIDAEFGILPLAVAVTKKASSDIWRWFLGKIRDKVTQRKGLCVISSPHRDIVSVFNEPNSRWQEPWAYHRFCLDHFCSSFHNIFQGNDVKNLVEKAGSTSREKEFDSYMKDIKKKNPEARRWLDVIPPHKWALAHDNGRRRYGLTKVSSTYESSDSSDVELFSLTLTGGMIQVFDEIRGIFNKSLENSRSSLYRGYAYSKPVMDKLEEFRTASVAYVITPLDRKAFQVSIKKEEWIVQLNESTCTCGEFQDGKFPCLHALAVCVELRVNPLQYVDECYTLERLYKTYSAKFYPVPEVSAWPEPPGFPTLFPPVISRTNASGKSTHKTTQKC